MYSSKFLLVVLLAAFFWQNIFAATGAFTDEDYVKALWMATRFYGGQRSGEGPNWLIMDTEYPTSFTQDKYNGIDVSGGWFDCGDHVMFGQTQYWAAYSLAKAYQIFPKGFYDFYSPDYSGYVASGNWDKPEGGKPNYIPDIIDELVYEADYIAKAAIDDNTFISQKGDGDPDHKYWVTAGYMSTFEIDEGGEPRNVYARKDRAMASYGAATLAVMSRILDSLGIYPERVALYKEKALTAYNAAKNAGENAVGSEGGGFYPPNEDTNDDYATASIEMYMLTGEQTYLQTAQAQESKIKNVNYWGYCYNNNYDIAWFNLATTPGASTTALETLNNFTDTYKTMNKSEGKLINVGDNWGTLRYPLAAAFMLGLTDVANGDNSNLQIVYDQVDFVMGANNAKRSFISGFLPKGDGYTTIYTPHHRNVFQSNEKEVNNDTLKIPQKNRAFGALVANNKFSSEYTGTVDDYKVSEVCTDYNVGLVGALAYIVSQIAPADEIVPPIVPVISQPGKLQFQNPVIRFVGTHEFPAQNKSFTVRIFDLKGNLVSLIKSDGQAVRFTPQNRNIHFATLRE
ncbi:MAG: glycoside hydrolase family 9 protein [Fibromonadaceae bacterium]|jgi:hypothetical protein|nr:glycoside hydrolase family 9 protein [Fibromonadaceae bacterium]